MEIKQNQLLKVNSNPTDWNQYLAKLWKDNGHEPDLKAELTVSDLNVFGQRNWRFRD